ncbi:MAG TPA: GNAT family N-acetyltransferase [Rhabdochlamydiaceae bacterium]|nr:GNAT family N-acetyltransferase [Rhabdochlamydiaceae bacterium]
MIDIAIATEKDNLNEVSEQLQSLGYEFRPTFSTPDRLYFIIYLPDPEEEIRRYHVHLTYPENTEWKEFLTFRDYLREHPEALQEYAKMKQQAAQEANHEGERYRKLKNPMFEKVKLWIKQTAPNRTAFHFAPAKSSQRALLHQWFQQNHIKEWMHGVGLQNTLNGLEKFFQGESNTTYWIGYDKDTPFAFLITSPEGKDAITLDLFICDLNYLGKGLAVRMIREFLISHFSNMKRVLIDPEATNTRAIHVYEKVGFKITGEFIASWHPVPHYQMELQLKDLLDESLKK